MSNKIDISFNNSNYNTEFVLGSSDALRVSKMLDMLPENKRVLDVACNDGTITSLIKKKNPDTFAIDISKPSTERSKHKGIDVIRSDALHLPFPDRYFDIVVACEVIEHIFDTDSFLLELKRVLKIGGNIIITSPNLGSLQNRIKLLFGLQPYCCELSIRRGNAGHIRAFTNSGLNKLLLDNGFYVFKRQSDFVYIPIFSKLFRCFNTDKWLGDIFASFGVILIFKAIK